MEENSVFCANAYLDEVPTPFIEHLRCGNISNGFNSGEDFGDFFGYYCDTCAEIVRQYVANIVDTTSPL